MKKNILSLAALLAIGTMAAQVRIVNNATNLSVTNSPAFIDASSNTTVNNSTNIGKGILFPRVDLTTMTAFQTGLVTGIPNSFPTRFDGLIVYNTASSGTAGIGSTSGTLTPGYWYYENKSATNTGGTWKPLAGTASGGDNLGNHTATQDLAMNGNAIRLKTSDTNNELVYNATVDGPRLFGNAGGYLGTVNGTNALTWDSSGKLKMSNAGGNKRFVLYDIASDDHQFYGFGINSGTLRYQVEIGANHIFYAATSSTASNELFRIQSSGDVYAARHIYGGTNGFFRAKGAGGFYFEDYGGGWNMIDSNWIRAMNNKNITTGGVGKFDTKVETALLQTTNVVNNKKIVLYEVAPDDNQFYGIGVNPGIQRYQVETGAKHVFYAATSSTTSNELFRIESTGDVYATRHIYGGTNGFFRAKGTGGFYFEDYGGGWNMTDSDWIRAMNNKNIYTGGSITAGGTVTTPRVQGPSDRRFKKDITPIMDATAKLNLLNGYTYTWRDKKEFPGQTLGEGKDMGVIAQEVEKVFPDAVMTNKEGYKSVNYNALIPVLIEALKETNNRVHVLEAQLDKLQQAGTQATAAELKRK